MEITALAYLMNKADAGEYDTEDDFVEERWGFFASVMEEYADKQVEKAIKEIYEKNPPLTNNS